jgi:chromosome segregation ATPase
VQAQTARTGGTANAQLLQQLQQLASERTTLQAENARMKKELEDIRKDRDALKKAQQVVGTRVKEDSAALARATSEKNASQEELQRYKEKMEELIAKFRETAQELRQVEIEGNTAKQTLATRDRDLKVCLEHNQALYKLDDEVLNRLEHQSVWSRVATVEPFTRIKRVQLENLVDDYKARADDQRLKQAPQTAPAGPAAPTTPATAPSTSGTPTASPAPAAPGPTARQP